MQPERVPLRGNVNPIKKSKTCWKTTCTIFIVTMLCAISAYGMMRLVFYFNNEDTTSTNTTSTSTSIMTSTTTTQITTVTSTTTTIPATTKPPSCQNRRIVGFFNENESTEITPSQLEKLTHAVFAYVKMEYDGQLTPFGSEKAEDRFKDLKEKSKNLRTDLKLMIGIGGMKNSAYFGKVLVDESKKRNFIESITGFLEKHEIHGVDFYWTTIDAAEKGTYISFFKSLRKRFEKIKIPYTISITVPPIGNGKELGYDMSATLEYVDFVNVWSMNFNDEHIIAPIAPLHSDGTLNVDHNIRYYACMKRSPEKFNMAVPFFTRTWENVVEELPESFTTYNKYQDTRYSRNGRKWYSYNPESHVFMTSESEESLVEKIDYANKMNLGGVWIWTVDMGDGKNELLKILNSDELCNTANRSKYDVCS